MVGLMSGQAIVGQISGQTVISEVSGQPIRISGQLVAVSGEVVSKISGQSIYVTYITPPASVMTANILVPSSASGGTQLTAGGIQSVTLKSLSGDVWVGGTGSQAPYSGHGFLLQAGEAISVDVNNFSAIRVMAETSGNWVTYIGVA